MNNTEERGRGRNKGKVGTR